jgi:hypothetical protein
MRRLVSRFSPYLPQNKKAIRPPKAGQLGSECKVLRGTSHFYLQTFERGPRTPDYLRSPKLATQNGQKSILKIADTAKQVSREGRLISVHAAFSQGAFDGRIASEDGYAGADAKSLAREAFKKSLELRTFELRNNDCVRVWLAKRDGPLAAKIPHPLQVSKKIDGPGLLAGQSRKERSPDASRRISRYRLARFWIQEFQTDRTHILA